MNIDRSQFKGTPLIHLILQDLEFNISNEISNFKEYIFISSSELKSRQIELEKNYKHHSSIYLETEQDVLNQYIDEHTKLNVSLVGLFSNSIFLGIYSFLESNLKAFCNTIQKLEKQKISIDDFKRADYIQRSKDYLFLIFGLDFKDITGINKKIKDYQELRNCIAHNNSNIKKNRLRKLEQQPLYQYIRGTSEIELKDNGDFLIIDSKFLERFCDDVAEFLKLILNKIKSKLKEKGF